MKTNVAITLFIALVLISGCATEKKITAPPERDKDMIVLVADEDGKVGAIRVANEGGAKEITKANTAIELADSKTMPVETKVIDEKEVQRIFGSALKAKPLEPAKFLFYFISGTSRLTKESEAQIGNIIESIKVRQPYEIVVIGHTDTTGTDAHNMKLSAQRAEVVKDFLVSKGIDARHIETSYHGKRDLLVPTADNVSEPRNRRVEVVVR